jgi:hypothetical protein
LVRFCANCQLSAGSYADTNKQKKMCKLLYLFQH